MASAFGSSRSLPSFMSNLRKQLTEKLSKLSSPRKSSFSHPEIFDDFLSGRSYRTSNSSAVSSLESLEQATQQISKNTNSLFNFQNGQNSSPSIVGTEHFSVQNTPVSSSYQQAFDVSEESSLRYCQQEYLDALTNSEEENVVSTAKAVTMVPVRHPLALEAEQVVPVLGERHNLSSLSRQAVKVSSQVIAEDYEAELDAQKKYPCNEGSLDSRIISSRQCEDEASWVWKTPGAPNNNDTSLFLSHSEASKGHIESPSHVLVSSRKDDIVADVPCGGMRKLASQLDDEDKLVYQPLNSPSANSKFPFSSPWLCRKLGQVPSKYTFTKTTDRLKSSRSATYIRDFLSTYNGALFHGNSRVSKRKGDRQTLPLNLEDEKRQAGKWIKESGLGSSVSSDKVPRIMGQSTNSLVGTEIIDTRDTDDDSSIKEWKADSRREEISYTSTIAPKQKTEDKASRIVNLMDLPSFSTSGLETYDFEGCPSTTSFFSGELKSVNLMAVAYDSASISSVAIDPSGWRDNTPRIKADSGASWLIPDDSGHTFHQAMLNSQAQRDERLRDLGTRFSRQGRYLKGVMKENS